MYTTLGPWPLLRRLGLSPLHHTRSQRRKRRRRLPLASSRLSQMSFLLVLVLGCTFHYINGQPIIQTNLTDDKCGAIGSCGDCVKTSLGCSWCGASAQCLSPRTRTVCPGSLYSGSIGGCSALPTTPDDEVCRAYSDCGICVR